MSYLLPKKMFEFITTFKLFGTEMCVWLRFDKRQQFDNELKNFLIPYFVSWDKVQQFYFNDYLILAGRKLDRAQCYITFHVRK
jgi:hypothetical protein